MNRTSPLATSVIESTTLKPILVHRVAGKNLHALRDRHLRLQLDALLAALDPDQGLDAERALPEPRHR